jgi:perosamine synthetase
MSQTHLHSNIDKKLAIEGGTPVRAKPIAPIVEVSPDCKRKIQDLLDMGILSNWYGGNVSHEFEHAFANFLGMQFCVAVNSGTSALHVAYVAAGIGPGDEVIIPSIGYVSAASAAIQEGALPIICDVEPQTLGMSQDDLERRITSKTKLIVPVHMWGVPNDMGSIMTVSKKYNISVLEDCGQSHGASYKGQLVGTFGDMAAFSFAPRKHISTGQGGMAIFRHEQHWQKARSAANKGKGRGWHDYQRIGYSYVMGDMEALIGIDGLTSLKKEVERRRRAAYIYESYLVGSGIELLSVPPECDCCYFKYPIRLPMDFLPLKEFMINALNSENISTRASHPPMHTIPWLAEHLRKQSQNISIATAPRPIAEQEAPRILEVETGPGMSEQDVHISAQGILKVWKRVMELYQQGVIPEISEGCTICK